MDDINYAIKLKPNLGILYCTRGEILLLLGKSEEAIKDFEKSLDLGYEQAQKELDKLK